MHPNINMDKSRIKQFYIVTLIFCSFIYFIYNYYILHI